jgi:hypothetical protein
MGAGDNETTDVPETEISGESFVLVQESPITSYLM